MTTCGKSGALAPPASPSTRPPVLLFGTATGVLVTNLFAPQTLVGVMGASLGLAPMSSGLMAMITLLGYAAGLFLLVPLADVAPHRRLVRAMLAVAAAAAATAACSPSAALLLAALFVLGAASSVIQVLVPIAAAMVGPDIRGRVIGDIMGGLMVGILLSRPLASLLADTLGWRAFYAASAVASLALGLTLVRGIPDRLPPPGPRYLDLIVSLGSLLRREPVLRRRAASAALSMAAFSLFWTAVALRLAQPPYSVGQRGIAVFALVGAAAAFITPWVGRAGDRGWTRPVTAISHLGMVGAFALAAWAGSAWHGGHAAWIAMGLAAIVLDAGVTGDQTLGRRAVNLLDPAARSRVNALFVGLFFLGGAAGSALAGVAWSLGQWQAICATGAALGLAALLVPGTPK